MNIESIKKAYGQLGIKLSEKSNKLWSTCPFHKESSPSFCVFPDDGSYRCFGCQEHGNFDNIKKIFGDDSDNFPTFMIDIDTADDNSDNLIEQMVSDFENDIRPLLKPVSFDSKEKFYDGFDTMLIGLRIDKDESIIEKSIRLKKKLNMITKQVRIAK